MYIYIPTARYNLKPGHKNFNPNLNDCITQLTDSRLDPTKILLLVV